MSDKEIVAQTIGGKNIVVEHDKMRPGLYKIVFSPGGELPKDLEGHWTSKSKARDAIDLYLAKMQREDEERKAREEVSMEFNPKPKRGRPAVNG